MKKSDVEYCQIIEKLVYIELLLEENKEVEKALTASRELRNRLIIDRLDSITHSDDIDTKDFQRVLVLTSI